MENEKDETVTLTIQEIDRRVCDWTVNASHPLTEEEQESLVDHIFGSLEET